MAYPLLLPQLNDVTILAVMTVLLGLYWAVGSNLCIGPTQDLALLSYCAHQMFGVYCASKASSGSVLKKESSAVRTSSSQTLKIFNEGDTVATTFL